MMQATRSFGRLTAKGSRVIEEELAAVLREVGAAVAEALPGECCRSLVLLGGYGRGEGGVVVADGREKPHNNLDFLFITGKIPLGEEAQVRQTLETVLTPLRRRHGLGMDCGVIAAAQLARAPCLTMWYDMVHGHKTILGDAGFVPSLRQFTVERIVPGDMLKLLVNRGTLLLINEALLALRPLTAPARDLVVKHIMKAVIGYGDALLFFRGNYHWSYVEKRKRMQDEPDVEASFGQLYDAAMEFRFQPAYRPYRARDAAAWNAEVLAAMEPVHRRCEALRLGEAEVDWATYPRLALGALLTAEGASARAWARKARNLTHSCAFPARASLREKLGCRVAGAGDILPVLFPLPAYGLEHAEWAEWAARALGAADVSVPELRRAYLKRWSENCDPNFGEVMKNYGLSFEPGTAS